MIDKYESLPEWLRWVLFLPTYIFIIIASSLLFRFMNHEVLNWFVFKRIFEPLASGIVIAGAASLLIPRGKKIAAYLLTCAFAVLVLLGVILLILPESDFTWKDFIANIFLLAGGVYFIRSLLPDLLE